uniref:Neprosin activation peptide domain-containing protein n=1 Tax=Oryza nivara TaxID=4536 RepID=A0A0E0GAK6_ORYNI
MDNRSLSPSRPIDRPIADQSPSGLRRQPRADSDGRTKVVVLVEPEPEERPKVGGAAVAHGEAAEKEVVFPMAWTDEDESCPEGTMPMRQTTKRDSRWAQPLETEGSSNFGRPK